MTENYNPPAPTDIRMMVLEECVAELFVMMFALTSNPLQAAEAGVARIRKRRDEYMKGAARQEEGRLQSDMIEGAAHLNLMANRIAKRFSDAVNAAAAVQESGSAVKN